MPEHQLLELELLQLEELLLEPQPLEPLELEPLELEQELELEPLELLEQELHLSVECSLELEQVCLDFLLAQTSMLWLTRWEAGTMS